MARLSAAQSAALEQKESQLGRLAHARLHLEMTQKDLNLTMDLSATNRQILTPTSSHVAAALRAVENVQRWIAELPLEVCEKE